MTLPSQSGPMVPISRIEEAINVWRDRTPGDSQYFALCREARVLADVYGLMIVSGQDAIEADRLSPEQLAVLDAAGR
ncbi:DUF3717 domain-containing protein [Paraburkholderia megapolitana]|uniref:DUF3717 domain-containing protein n=1 Tax=Paraburkholderia megapolitana TaxID=420953 RepID=UPI0038BC018A